MAKEVLGKNSWASIGDISRGGSDLTTEANHKKLNNNKDPRGTNIKEIRT